MAIFEKFFTTVMGLLRHRFFAFFLLMCTTACFALTSCQPEVEETLPPEEEPPVDPPPTSPRIAAMYEIDSIAPGVEDTVKTIILTYDAQGRASKVKGSWSADDYYEIEFHYVGNSEYPYLQNTRSIEDEIDDQYVDSLFLFYENGYVIKDSIRYFQTQTGSGGQLFYSGSRVNTFTVNSPTNIKVVSAWRKGLPATSYVDDDKDAEAIVAILQSTDQAYEQQSTNDEVTYFSRYKVLFSQVLYPPGLPDVKYRVDIGPEYVGVLRKFKYVESKIIYDSSTDSDPDTQFSYEVNAEGYPVLIRTWDPDYPTSIDRTRVRYQ